MPLRGDGRPERRLPAPATPPPTPATSSPRPPAAAARACAATMSRSSAAETRTRSSPSAIFPSAGGGTGGRRPRRAKSAVARMRGRPRAAGRAAPSTWPGRPAWPCPTSGRRRGGSAAGCTARRYSPAGAWTAWPADGCSSSASSSRGPAPSRCAGPVAQHGPRPGPRPAGGQRSLLAPEKLTFCQHSPALEAKVAAAALHRFPGHGGGRKEGNSRPPLPTQPSTAAPGQR